MLPWAILQGYEVEQFGQVNKSKEEKYSNSLIGILLFLSFRQVQLQLEYLKARY